MSNNEAKGRLFIFTYRDTIIKNMLHTHTRAHTWRRLITEPVCIAAADISALSCHAGSGVPWRTAAWCVWLLIMCVSAGWITPTTKFRSTEQVRKQEGIELLNERSNLETETQSRNLVTSVVTELVTMVTIIRKTHFPRRLWDSKQMV